MKKYISYIAFLVALTLYSISSVAQEVKWKKIKVATIENIYDGTRYGWQYNETFRSFDIDNDGDNDILVGMTGDILDPLLPSDPLMYVIENLGNKVRLSDRDEENNLELYCYINCDNNSSEQIKNCRGVVFDNDKIVLQAFPYTDEYVLSIKK